MKWMPRRVFPPLARRLMLSMFHMEVCVMVRAATEKTTAATSTGVNDDTWAEKVDPFKAKSEPV